MSALSMSLRPLLALAFALGALGGCFLSANVPPSFRYNCKADSDCRVLTCRGDLVAIPDAEAAGLQLAEKCDDVLEADKSKFYEARQACLDGLCEYPCELMPTTCPAGKGYSLCFNGACATACGQDDERFPDPDATCSSPQHCVLFGDEIELDPIKNLFGGGSGGSGSQGQGQTGQFKVEDLLGTGVCGIRCDADDARPCAPGMYCGGAMCLPDCANPDATPCAEGSTCFPAPGSDFSVCLPTCDPAADMPCDEGETCVPGINICLPTCLGEDATVCEDGQVCDETLGICIPEDIATGTDTDATTTDSETGTGTSG
jgi:hypothetical protein